MNDLPKRIRELRDHYFSGANGPEYSTLGEAANALEAAPTSAESVAWQGMDTAPMENERVLICTENGFVDIGRYVSSFAPVYGDTSPGWYSVSLDRRCHPKKWAPMPSPPITIDT